MKPVRQRNTVVTVLVMIIIALLGLLLLFVGNANEGIWADITVQVGLAVLVSIAIGAMWDFVGRRWLADEVFEKMSLGSDLQQWGLKRLTFDWSGIAWKEHFSSSRRLDVFVGYGKTWRNNEVSDLDEFLSDSRNTLRVCMPDPGEPWLMEAMGQRFDKNADSLANEVLEAARYYSGLRAEHEASVLIYFRKGEPTYAAYLFDNSGVVTMYRHRKGRTGKIPTFVTGKGEFLDFLVEDFNDAVASSKEVADDEL